MPHLSKWSWEEGPLPELTQQACPLSSGPVPPRENPSLLPFPPACPVSPEQGCSFSLPCARDMAVMPITLMEERHKIGHGAIWLRKAKQLHGARKLTPENQSCPHVVKTQFFSSICAFFLLFFLSQGPSPAPGHNFCGRRMVDQGLAVMGRGCTDALPTSRTGITTKLTCGKGAPICPLLPGWALQAGWQPVSCPELKLGMGTAQKINNLDSKDELTHPH